MTQFSFFPARRDQRLGMASCVLVSLMLQSAIAPFAAAQERWYEVRKILAEDGQDNAYFGSRVSVSGSLAVIGAPLDHGNGLFTGAAYVFDTRAGKQLRKLSPEGGLPEDCFGWSVACSGNRAVIGNRPMNPTEANLGSVYVIDITTGQQLRRLESPITEDPFPLACSVAVQGRLALVGVPSALHGIQTWLGAAYVFDIEAGEQLLKVTPPDGEYGDHFGNEVLLHDDRLIVSAYRDVNGSLRTGSVYVFDLASGELLHKLTPADPVDEMAFGDSIAASGGRLVIAAYHDNDNGRNSGSVYIYDLYTGEQLHKITPSDGFEEQTFGRSVAIDGQRLIVGAAGDDHLGYRAGAVYIFDIATGEQITKLVASDGVEFDQFGVAVGIAGNHLVIGARGVDDRGWLAGAAYLFHAENLLAVEPDPPIGGREAAFRVYSARPNEPIWLVYSLRGIGATWIPQLGVTADLATPRLVFGPGMTDEVGNWIHTRDVPRVSRVTDVWLQALQRGHKTSVATMQIDP